ncbi:OPT-domain-containing protein [Mycena capillaripes]|nr:OPT-domain-containing protein [Mycena capillaripes]
MEKDAPIADNSSSHSSLDEKGVGLADIVSGFSSINRPLMNRFASECPRRRNAGGIGASIGSQNMTAAEIDEAIHRIVEEHGDDPNFPPAVLTAARRYLFDEDLKQNPAEYQHIYEELKVEAALIIINSPYAEVRAVVDNHDDTNVSGATFRTLVIGTIFVGAGGFINQFFSIRNPTITVLSNCAQVLAFPAAKLMELLPTTTFTTFGYIWSLNPGKFNPKEHMLITIMANVEFNTPYTNNIIWVQYLPLYFNQPWATGFGYQIMIALSTNFIGYGLADCTRRFLVYPAHAIWPTNLAAILNVSYHIQRAFHAEKENVANRWTLSKMRWFLYCFCGMFVYFWFPDFIFQALSYFNWMTWIAPNNVNLAAITGSISGLGFNPIPTFDWNKFTVFVDPMISPSFLAAGNILIYGVFFAVYTATLTHAFLYHRHEIAHGFKSILSRKKTSDIHRDVHVRLMMSYKEVPEWQYLIILVLAIALGAAGVGAYPTETTPAVVLYGVFLAAIFVIPIGIILAITNVQITLNVLAELFGGLWFPGNAVAMNYFKSYGYVTTAHTLNFAQDLKLAHYMHIPPYHTFMTKIPGVCTPDQIDHFTCPGINTFFTASVLWGTLGPKRMFGAGGIYNGLLYCFPIGAVIPIPFYFLRKRFKSFEYVHLPVILAGGLSWPPYNMANLWPAVPVAWVFNVYIKKHYIAWWSKYNYITTTAFSAAIAIAAAVIFFAVEWQNVEIDWIGNTRPFDGCDAAGCARLPIPDSGFFCPGPGEFH